MHADYECDEELHALFERRPELCGFAIRDEDGQLFVSDVGILPPLDRVRCSEVFQEIARVLSQLLQDRPGASQWLRGRTFARSLH